jgi:hypothetical protein
LKSGDALAEAAKIANNWLNDDQLAPNFQAGAYLELASRFSQPPLRNASRASEFALRAQGISPVHYREALKLNPPWKSFDWSGKQLPPAPTLADAQVWPDSLPPIFVIALAESLVGQADFDIPVWRFSSTPTAAPNESAPIKDQQLRLQLTPQRFNDQRWKSLLEAGASIVDKNGRILVSGLADAPEVLAVLQKLNGHSTTTRLTQESSSGGGKKSGKKLATKRVFARRK